MNLKNISLSVIFLALSVYNFVYTPLSYISYWLGVILLVASFGWLTMGDKKKKREYKETKADKKKWDRYGIYAAVIFVPFYILFLILYAD